MTVLSRAAAAFVVAAVTLPPVAAQNFSRLERFTFVSPDLRDSGLGVPGSIAVVGDLDGDGLADLALGAFDEDSGAGRVYLVSTAAGALIRTVPSPQSVQAERFGATVETVPDLDGDGLDDLAVGATAASVGGLASVGRVVVVSTASGATLRTIASPNPADGGAFGFSLARVPDVDGDGVDDLAVGAPGEDAPDPAGELQTNVGRAYLFSGATGDLVFSMISANPDEEGVRTIRGSDFGQDVSGVGDLDGDGLGGVLVGAPGEWTGDFDGDPAPFDGRLYVYRSPASAALVRRSPNPANRGNFAESVAGAPDLTGDGVPDYYVGAPDESLTAERDDEGQAYLYSGATGEPVRRYVSPEPSDDSSFGDEVSLVPDMTGDGRPEVVFTEPTLCCEKMAAAYVFDGATGTHVYTVETPDISWDLFEAVGLPDLDGDGRGELAVGLSVGTFDEQDGVTVFSGDLRRAEREPNDNAAEAQPLRGRSPVTIEGTAGGYDLGLNGQITIDDGRQSIEDVYRVDLVKPGLRVTLGGFDDDLDLYLMRPDLSFVEVSDGGGLTAESIDLPALPVGTYYVGVDFCGSFLLGRCQEDAGEWTPYTLTVEGAFEAGVAAEGAPDAAAALAAPRPNPFTGNATVDVTLAEPGPARLSLLDVLGREVAVLLDGPQRAGTTAVRVGGAGLAAGVYVLRLQTAAGVSARQITRAR